MAAKAAKKSPDTSKRSVPAQRKGSGGKSTAGSRNAAKKTSSDSSRSRGNAAVSVKRTETAVPEEERTSPLLVREAMMWGVIAAGVFLFISYFGFGGFVGSAVSDVSFGIFGWTAYLFPVFLVISVFFLVSNKGSRIAGVKFAAALLLFLTVCSFFGIYRAEEYTVSTVGEIYRKSAVFKDGGGVIGGGICKLLCPALGTVGAVVILSITALICVILITQKSIMRGMKHQSQKMYYSAKESSARRREAYEEERRRRKEEDEEISFRREQGYVPFAGKKSVFDEQRSGRQSVNLALPTGDVKLREDPAGKRGRKGSAAVSSRRTELEVPVIFPSAPTGRRLDHRVTGMTNDTEIAGRRAIRDPQAAAEPVIDVTDRTQQGRRGSEVREILPNRSMTPAENPENEEKETRFINLDPGLQIEGIEDAARKDEPYESVNPDRKADIHRIDLDFEQNFDEDLLFDEPVEEDEAETAPEPVRAAASSASPKSSNYMDDVFASETRLDNTSSGHTFSDRGAGSRPGSAPAADGMKAAAQGKVIRTGTEAEAEQSQQPESHGSAIRRNPRSSEKEIQEGIADVQAEMEKAAEVVKKEYVFPPLDLLKRGSSRSGAGQEQEVRQTAAKLQTTLDSFGVRAKVTNVSCGPSVTRYELTPEQGVKVKQIVALADDIKLNLAAADIRIEAPIPGKSAVGIEVPNAENSVVKLRDLLETDDFTKHKSNLAFAVGKDIGGKTVVTDIAKMPHLLIAGATGSGKSVCINTLIMSLLYKANPDDVKLIMIDPKVVELSVYNGIPHLFIPVVTDPKKAAGALNWAVAEMDDRYNKFAEYGVRDLKGYNQRVEALKDIDDPNKPKKLPQIVIIVDELADLMMVAPGEVEDSICRLAQLARAAGIHLIIATQRPSVNVITGLIKANMPSRIAFSVSSGIDSRTILDMYGAEKLLGKGDMLFYPQGYQKPARVQGAFVSDEEVSDVVDFMKEQNSGAGYSTEMEAQLAKVQQAGSAASRNEDVDALFADAGKFIIEKDKASIGMLQRVFKIGFNRAARIMDQLSDAGIVGPEEGTKPRKILMSQEEFENYLEQN